jgi:hypothetical protein
MAGSYIYISDYLISYSRQAGRMTPTAEYICNSGPPSDQKATIV